MAEFIWPFESWYIFLYVSYIFLLCLQSQWLQNSFDFDYTWYIQSWSFT